MNRFQQIVARSAYRLTGIIGAQTRWALEEMKSAMESLDAKKAKRLLASGSLLRSQPWLARLWCDYVYLMQARERKFHEGASQAQKEQGQWDGRMIEMLDLWNEAGLPPTALNDSGSKRYPADVLLKMMAGDPNGAAMAWFFRNGCDPNERNHGTSLLASMASAGNWPAMELLLDNGGDPTKGVERTNYDGGRVHYTVLAMCIQGKDAKVALSFLNKDWGSYEPRKENEVKEASQHLARAARNDGNRASFAVWDSLLEERSLRKEMPSGAVPSSKRRL